TRKLWFSSIARQETLSSNRYTCLIMLWQLVLRMCACRWTIVNAFEPRHPSYCAISAHDVVCLPRRTRLSGSAPLGIAAACTTSRPSKLRGRGVDKVRCTFDSDRWADIPQSTQCAMTGLMHCSKWPSFDHLVGSREQRRWNS